MNNIDTKLKNRTSRIRDIRIPIMVAIAVMICIISVGDKPVKGPTVSASPAVVTLCWDNTTLELKQAGKINENNPLPARYAPLLFKKIPVNSADSQSLETINGVGQVLAGRIIASRQKWGRFDTAEDLLKVPGIGERRKNMLSGQVTFE